MVFKSINFNLQTLGMALVLAGINAGCSGCFSNEQEIEREERATEAEELRLEFFKTEGLEIRLANEELKSIESDWANRKRQLAAVLRNIGRAPSADVDYLKWIERLDKLQEDRGRLNSKAGDAFLAYAKFTLGLDAVSEEQYQATLREGILEAEGLRRQYQDLKEIKLSW